MTDLAVRFEDASDETFYKILAALASMKGKGVEKVRFREGRVEGHHAQWVGWFGEVHFLSKEAMEIFGRKIRDKSKRRWY